MMLVVASYKEYTLGNCYVFWAIVGHCGRSWAKFEKFWAILDPLLIRALMGAAWKLPTPKLPSWIQLLKPT